MAIFAHLARRVRHGISGVSVVRLSTSSEPIATTCNTDWNVKAPGTSAYQWIARQVDEPEVNPFRLEAVEQNPIAVH